MEKATKGHYDCEVKRISQLSNLDLLEDTLELAGGDDWDGDFTEDGQITYSLLEEELRERLESWLKK